MSQAATIDPVQAAIAAAQAAAQQMIAQQAAAVPAVANTNVPAPAPTPGRPLTMDDMVGGMAVDQWLGVKEHGFLLGKDKVLYDQPITVELDMTTAQPNFSIKFGNPAVYLRTYDRVTETRGGSWADAVKRAQAVDPKAYEYRSVDLPFLVTQPIKKGNTVLIEAGQTLGYSTPTTGWSAWQAFYADCARAGLTQARVLVELNFQKRTNKNGNMWGIVTYTLKGAV